MSAGRNQPIQEPRAGASLAALRPLRRYHAHRPGGHASPNAIGSHRGPFAALNPVNTQPNYLYYWQRKNPNDVMRFQILGWKVVTSSDPERILNAIGEEIPINADGSLSAFPDIILMKIHVNEYRLISEQKMRANEVALKGAEAEFESRGEQLAQRIGSEHAGMERGPLYTKGRGHGIGSI